MESEPIRSTPLELAPTNFGPDDLVVADLAAAATRVRECLVTVRNAQAALRGVSSVKKERVLDEAEAALAAAQDANAAVWQRERTARYQATLRLVLATVSDRGAWTPDALESTLDWLYAAVLRTLFVRDDDARPRVIGRNGGPRTGPVFDRPPRSRGNDVAESARAVARCQECHSSFYRDEGHSCQGRAAGPGSGHAPLLVAEPTPELPKAQRGPCGKVVYRSSDAAKRTHAKASFRIRTYECGECGRGVWHVTNGSKRKSKHR